MKKHGKNMIAISPKMFQTFSVNENVINIQFSGRVFALMNQS